MHPAFIIIFYRYEHVKKKKKMYAEKHSLNIIFFLIELQQISATFLSSLCNVVKSSQALTPSGLANA